MEYANGGDLMMYIHQDVFDEQRSCFYATCAVLWINIFTFKSNQIIYLDLKLDNLLLDRESYLKSAE